jgi:RHS repeat-associated protein
MSRRTTTVREPWYSVIRYPFPQRVPRTTAAYTGTGRPNTLSQPNGVSLAYSYDDLDRVTSMAWRRSPAPAFASWAYTHNNRGQRSTATDVTGRAAAYDYDDDGWLTSETISGASGGAGNNGAITYVLDGVGNRVSRTSAITAVPSASYSYDANDRLASDGYDLNGNTTSSSGATFGYDFENRLISKNSGAVTIVYDGDGNRVSKTVGGVTTKYLVDDLNPTGYLQVMEEVVGTAVQTRYTFGTRLVSQTRDVSTTPVTSYYGYDAHGNVAFLTDATGAVTDSYDYDAWGMLVASTGSTPNSRRYVGEEFGPDLGLLNLRARQYEPSRGRFWTIDPMMGDRGQPITLNRYIYAGSDPANILDPTGTTIIGYLTSGSVGMKVASGALSIFLLGVEKGATAAYNYNPAVNYSAKMIAATAGFWGDIATVETFLNPYPVSAMIGTGHVVWCMFASVFWNLDHAGRYQAPGPDTPPEPLCSMGR